MINKYMKKGQRRQGEKMSTDKLIKPVKIMFAALSVTALLFVFAGCGSYTLKPDTHKTETKVYTQPQGEYLKKEIPKEEKPLRFRNERLLKEHYEKHGIEMGFESADEYEEAASSAALNPYALHKKEKEDGDDVYYVKTTNEFVIVSKDGYIRTYFQPDSGIRYFNKQ